jgi:hypothetical protein
MITCIILGSSWPSSPSNGGVQVCTKEGLIKKSKKNIDRWAEITNGCTVSASDSLRVYIKACKATMANYTLFNTSIKATFVLLSNVSALSSILC